MTKVGVVSDVVPFENGGSTFGEIFSRCEFVCACLMGFKVRLDHFWRKKTFGCQSVNPLDPTDEFTGTFRKKWPFFGAPLL